MNLDGLLIGYGSIGRHHARALQSLCRSMVIIDSQEAPRGRAKQDFPSIIVADSLDKVPDMSWGATLAVVATWGPSHALLFQQLADRGVRRILCEKPLASSVALAQEMVRRAHRDRITLAVHHFVRYTRLAPALQSFAADHGMGDPVGLVVDGGAACLVTNGLHWIDFAADLFGDAPRRVVSTARGEPINPRSPDLMMYGGTAIWQFGDGREAIISLNNRSSIALRVRVYYRDTVAETDGDVSSVAVRRRDRKTLEHFPAVTRTGAATETLFEGRLPGMRPFPESLRQALVEVGAGEARTSSGADGAAAVSACVGALVAARDRRPVQLPIDPESSEGRMSWPIS